MRRSKKLAAVSMSAMLALSSMAGCTKKDAGDETTQATVASQPDTTAEVQTTTAAPADTTAVAVQENNTDASGALLSFGFGKHKTKTLIVITITVQSMNG